jgi:hypothetical protein
MLEKGTELQGVWRKLTPRVRFPICDSSSSSSLDAPLSIRGYENDFALDGACRYVARMIRSSTKTAPVATQGRRELRNVNISGSSLFLFPKMKFHKIRDAITKSCSTKIVTITKMTDIRGMLYDERPMAVQPCARKGEAWRTDPVGSVWSWEWLKFVYAPDFNWLCRRCRLFTLPQSRSGLRPVSKRAMAGETPMSDLDIHILLTHVVPRRPMGNTVLSRRRL